MLQNATRNKVKLRTECICENSKENQMEEKRCAVIVDERKFFFQPAATSNNLTLQVPLAHKFFITFPIREARIRERVSKIYANNINHKVVVNHINQQVATHLVELIWFVMNEQQKREREAPKRRNSNKTIPIVMN